MNARDGLRRFFLFVSLSIAALAGTPQARAADTLVLDKPLPTLSSLNQHFTAATGAAPTARAPAAQPKKYMPAQTLTVDPICDIFANGYDTFGATHCPGCFDSSTDFDETDMDCGGAYCKACADGKTCAVASDCSSSLCNAVLHKCSPVTCLDTIIDGGETDVDCGGLCAACTAGKNCLVSSDCASNVCTGGVCQVPACNDTVKNGNETDIDCGGGTCAPCATGKHCSADGDCSSTSCDFITGTCATDACHDERKDNSETAVDCGGSCITKCAPGQGCVSDSDCTTTFCITGVASSTCTSNHCVDNHKDNNETGVDCGGGTCGPCGFGGGCQNNGDCSSNACDGISFTCDLNQCQDNHQDGSETDIDCGGSTGGCPRCAVGKKCSSALDCTAGHICNTGVTPHVCQ